MGGFRRNLSGLKFERSVSPGFRAQRLFVVLCEVSKTGGLDCCYFKSVDALKGDLNSNLSFLE